MSEIERDIARLMKWVERENGAPLPPAATRFAKSQQMQVMVGDSAALSILAETGDKVLPESIDDVPIKRVSHFPGFEVVVL